MLNNTDKSKTQENSYLKKYSIPGGNLPALPYPTLQDQGQSEFRDGDTCHGT